MVRFRSPTGVLPNQIGKSEIIDHLNHESRQVILVKSVVQRRRRQVVGLAVGDDEIWHGRGSVDPVTMIIAYNARR